MTKGVYAGTALASARTRSSTAARTRRLGARPPPGWRRSSFATGSSVRTASSMTTVRAARTRRSATSRAMLPGGPGGGPRQVAAGPPSVEADVHAGRGVGDGRVEVGVECDDDLSGFVLGLDARVHALALVASGVGVAHGDRAVLPGLVDDDHGVADRDLGHLVGVGLDGDDGQFAHRFLPRARPYRGGRRPARCAGENGSPVVTRSIISARRALVAMA